MKTFLFLLLLAPTGQLHLSDGGVITASPEDCRAQGDAMLFTRSPQGFEIVGFICSSKHVTQSK